MPLLPINQTIGGILLNDTLAAIKGNFNNSILSSKGALQTFSDLFTEFAADNITAHAGGGQASATALVAQMNRITVAATAGDSVSLPPSAAGLELLVINHGANAIQVFGAGTDTINDVAYATGVSQMPNSAVIYACVSAGSWYTDGLGLGYYQGYSTTSYANSLTAKAGGGQSGATMVPAMINRFTTVATANDSALLPSTVQPGLNIYIANASVNSMNVFPATGDAINALAANAAFAIPGGKTCIFITANTGFWHAILSA